MQTRLWTPEKAGPAGIWIIDADWPGYAIEQQVFSAGLPSYQLFHSTPASYRHDLPLYAHRADAILTQIDVKMTKDILAQLPHCRIIVNYSTGSDNIDVAAAAARKIQVASVPGYCEEEIAGYILTAITGWERPLHAWAQVPARGKWGWQAVSGSVHRLTEQELFLAGFGRIGKKVARRARGIGLRVSAWSPSLTAAKARPYDVCYKELADGLRTADFVSLHLRYTQDTFRFMNEERLHLMKKTAVLINTARGGILDTRALLQAVQQKKIAGAILDVLEQEPPDPEDAVLHTPGITVTPHIAYYSAQSLVTLRHQAAERVVRALTEEESFHEND